MSATFGSKFKITIYGESHGDAIGVVIDGVPSGIELDIDFIAKEMKRRAPGQNQLSTPRKENDIPEIMSGIFNNHTTGAPINAIIRNTNRKSKDYSEIKVKMRPGQADYPANQRYDGFNDYRGSGKFSGRITAPLVFAGAIAKQILRNHNITIGAHIKSVKHIQDDSIDFKTITHEDLHAFHDDYLPLVNKNIKTEIESLVQDAKAQGDSVGGVVECIVLGVSPGIGNPFFDSIEAVLSHLMFSVPAVKGIEFGSGFDITRMYASEANDAYYYDENGLVKTKSNHNGGITGGISNGMPIQFNVAIKAPSSILKEQETINISTKENTSLSVKGRHDPIIVPRVIPVIEAVTAIGILDLILTR